MRDLLIFYGEYRNFDVTIPQLKNLDKFDIVVSTWNYTKEFDRFPPREDFLARKIGEHDIIKYISHAKVTISEYDTKYQHNTTNMISCWQRGLNMVDGKQYNRIFLHRVDMISTFDNIINEEFEDVIYGEPGEIIDGKMDWFNDYIFAGNFDIMQRFIKSFELIDYPIPHKPIADVMIKMNFPFKEIKSFKCGLEYQLVRYNHRQIVDYLNKNKMYYFDLPKTNKIKIDYENISERFLSVNL